MSVPQPTTEAGQRALEILRMAADEIREMGFDARIRHVCTDGRETWICVGDAIRLSQVRMERVPDPASMATTG
jgi:hypothetical protein